MSSRYHRLLIYDVKRTTKIDGMGPFNVAGIESFVKTSQWPSYSWIIHVVPVIPCCSELTSTALCPCGQFYFRF